MGYESTIYFARKSNLSPMPQDDNHIFAIKEVELRLGKLGGMPSCFRKPTNYFVYSDDGDTPMLEDKYGEPLYECTLGELWDWTTKELEESRAEGESYYRHSLNLLRCTLLSYGYSLCGIYKPNAFGQNMVVMHYGY